MNGGFSEIQDVFRLKATRAAKVSEISEATAASAVAPDDRVNFHIGNPVQEPRLSLAYLRTILGLPVAEAGFGTSDANSLLEELGWDRDQRSSLDLFTNLVLRSGPYLPRGGFPRNTPSPLAITFSEWLERQQEPLTYDLGKTTGRREIIFASGGIAETLRVFFHAIDAFLFQKPAHVLLFRTDLPSHITSFEGLRFSRLPDNEHEALRSLHTFLSEHSAGATFLVLGGAVDEESRRALRAVSLTHPIMFLEINDAPNHLSLAREAKLIGRVIRFLTPGIFSPSLKNFPIVFVAGNSDYLTLLETLHFQLKGTPSASEVEILSYLIRQPHTTGEPPDKPIAIEPPLETPGLPLIAETVLAEHAFRVERTLQSVLTSVGTRVASTGEALESHAEHILTHHDLPSRLQPIDKFSGTGPETVLDEMTKRIDDPQWVQDLQQSFLGAFVHQHPEYQRSSCIAISGSARTALSLLGFHCGIKEVITLDLSWTYEHCFPTVVAVPLETDLGLDVDAVLAAVDQRIQEHPAWARTGAVVLNNPHNATGRVFDLGKMKRLLRNLLSGGTTVIDDLSYQNVAPVEDLPTIPTLRQLAEAMLRSGELSSEESDRLITIHSLSKTDCLAGARLSVAEIRHPALRDRFRSLNETIKPNIGAMMLGYLFYRNPLEITRAYWRLRNSIFRERMEALESALRNLPADRNPYGIQILPPEGSMYPIMVINRLPAGLSLEWVSSRLASQGIGLIPLTTFARSEKAFETGRKAFRLTLGGTDGAPTLLKKTRRVLIDLNRLIDEESAQYSRQRFALTRTSILPDETIRRWNQIERSLHDRVGAILRAPRLPLHDELRDERLATMLLTVYVPDRFACYRQRLIDRAFVLRESRALALADKGKTLGRILGQEFFKDTLDRREHAFRSRLFDRTVHPTQMYSLRTEIAFDAVIECLLQDRPVPGTLLDTVAKALVEEYFGLNVAITAADEAEEILLDLDAHIMAELSAEIQTGTLAPTFLSFWGDWDGSNRPSGQGHLLVASVLLRNVALLSRLLHLLTSHDRSIKVNAELLAEIEQLPAKARHFNMLMSEITSLTHHLEGRYRGILPFHAKPGRLRRVGMALHLAHDPVTSLWHHNDRLEKRMRDLRRKRKDAIEYSFSVNKRLRKQLHELIPALLRNLDHPVLLREAVLYRDLLKRFVITPRIHQNMITAQDPFAIDTTVFNMIEINEISGRNGNPGMVLALQVSMATRPEALIDLDRKVRARREHVLRDNKDVQLPGLWLVPLFEDQEAVLALEGYLTRIWDYALQSRRMNQETHDRFAEMLEEVFIAGSDLSQQLSQAAGAQLYRQAKYVLIRWLAEHGLAHRVRLKLGSGEPMQRQGGYYSEVSGMPAFVQTDHAKQRFAAHLRESTRRSTVYATTPMLGVFAGGDLRTVQSALGEQLRHLSLNAFAQLLHHLRHRQRTHLRDLIRAGEELSESRLQSTSRGEQALERLTVGTKEKALEAFLGVLTDNFRQILYGRDEDVVGIHIVSYFIARTTPPLRDRPTVRSGQGGKGQGNRILERIAETIPFSRYGSLLRAIAHNQAQTAVLGINQLTTGLFRALDTFSRQETVEGDPESFLADRILPHLPVYEILQSLRLYQDVDLQHLRAIERAFPAGNSALLALREDIDAMTRYIPLFQQELLRRHGIDVSDFFESRRFIEDLLPTLRPDLVVLLQPEFFNTDIRVLERHIGGHIEQSWLAEVERHLNSREQISLWRARAWALLEQPVSQRVEAFVELAVSLYSISSKNHAPGLPPLAREPKLPSRLDSFFRMSKADDEMRQFLAAATEYLTIASEGMVEVPPNIIRAMKEVERIAKIEQQALAPIQQSRLRFYLLQIARLAGENG